MTAFGLLADVDNGYPVFLAEMTLLTALRTAGVSAMVAKHLARKDSKKMAMIGTGSQSEFQALGMRAVLGIEDLSVYDVDPHAMEKFRRNLEPLGFRIHLAKDVDEAVEGADIITTCTADKQQAKVLLDRQVKPGVHLNAIGGDCPGKTELESEILDRSTVFVEFPPQTRIEGEIQQKDPDFPVVEFWKVLTGEEPSACRMSRLPCLIRWASRLLTSRVCVMPVRLRRTPTCSSSLTWLLARMIRRICTRW